MGPYGAVLLWPACSLFADVVEVSESPGVEDAIAVAVVEVLDEALVARFAGLSVVGRHTIGLAPGTERGAGELDPVIDPDALKMPSCWHRRIMSPVRGCGRIAPALTPSTPMC